MGLVFPRRTDAAVSKWVLLPLTILLAGLYLLQGLRTGNVGLVIGSSIGMVSAVFPWLLSRYTRDTIENLIKTFLILTAWLFVLFFAVGVAVA